MKANFALSLSFEGIRLLHRAAGEWVFVSEVALDDPDLTSALSRMRIDAKTLEPEGLRTKLLLPDEQIKYLTIPTKSQDPGKVRRAAKAALDGATPYAVSELVLDFVVDGEQTYVAAVAQETLAEAEAFAVEHGFAPVSFSAHPDSDTFPGEPAFGATEHAAKIVPSFADVAANEDAPSTTPPQDLTGFEVKEGEPMPTLGGATREFAGSGGVLAGSLPGAEPIVAPPPPAPGSFISRRGNAPTPRPEPPIAAQTPTAPPEPTTQEVTSFAPANAEATAVGGKPRYLGLMLTLALIVFLAGVAAWASVQRGDGTTGLSRFFKIPPAPETLVSVDELTLQPEPTFTPQEDLRTASLSHEIPGALHQPEALATPAPPPGFDPAEAEAQYAVTGIWIMPPDVPRAPALMSLDNLYVTSIDRANLSFDAVALVPARQFLNDETLDAPNNPAPPGTQFALDSRGLVTPSVDGTLSPDGVLVFLGRPPLVPPAEMARTEIQPEPAVQINPAFAQIRPRLRPEKLVENTERSQLGGLSRSELAEIRPRLRPETTKQAEELDETPTAQAVSVSFRPALRPKSVVAAAAVRPRDTPTTQDSEPAPQNVAAVAPRTVTPAVPSRNTVTRQATVKNAINLNRVNLMGVYGTPSNRRALVRLSNGRYKKVKIGDRIDGGRVSAIGEGELRYQKGSRNVVLKMPKS